MAKKKTQRKAKSFSEALGLEYLFNNTITDFFLGLILFFASVYVIIAMVSFLNTGAADQSILEDLQQGEWINTGRQFQNYCGSWGAIISYWLMSVNFGFPAFLLPLFCVLVGFQLMHAYKINLLKWFLCMMVVMFWSSVTFSKLLTPLMGDLIFNPGGKHGLFVVQRLEDIMGPHSHPAHRCRGIPHLSYYRDHHGHQKGSQPYWIHIQEGVFRNHQSQKR